VLGIMRLPNSGVQTLPQSIGGRLSSVRRRLTQQLLALSELVVMFWCLAIAIRVVLDPLWRAMLWESPLAALGRLFFGLP
jgi:hypothetical protein